MRIESITLENFGSFESATIDLARIHSATISGPNGHGKSTAFVDAPLWALFGKCRTDTDSMIRLGADRMLVELVFMLDLERYRVIRSRSKATKAGKTELAFDVKTLEETWQPIGGGKLAETQEAIISVLNADFNLFASTNFLIQGQADKFSTAKPAERKTILSQILRLDQYPALKRAVMDRANVLAPELKHLQEERERLEKTSRKALTLKAQIDDHTAVLQQRAAELDGFDRQGAERLEFRAKKKADLEKTETAAVEVERLNQEQLTLEGSLGKIRHDLARADQIAAKREEITLQVNKVGPLDQSIVDQNLALDQLELVVRGHNAKHSELVERLAKEEGTIDRVKMEIEKLKLAEKNAKGVHDQKVRLRGQDVQRDTDAVRSLETVPCWKELQEKCPYTIQAIELSGTLAKKKEDLEALMAEDPVAEELPNFRADMVTRQQQLDELLKLSTREELEKLEREANPAAQKFDAAVVRLRELLKEREGLDKWIALKPELNAADREIERLKESERQGQEWLNKIQTELKAKGEVLATRQALQEFMKDAATLEVDLKKTRDLLSAVLDDLKEKITLTRREEQEAKAAGEQIAGVDQDLNKKRLEAEAYAFLLKAYTEIPVFLMEQAVPNLEHATNAILDQISPSGMKVRLETQRALKSSDRLAETLDILVRDVHGERPYENYSGGERFRLDLALRLGLSELLISRAGSQLETLVIDEGLGTLDSEGLDLLRECLARLESHFNLILVISHVDAIQGTFPTSINVEKGPHGSVVTSVE
jgi:exonuclease SbcC